MTDIESQIAQLNTELEAARAAYYNGDPTMTDGEYDASEAQLASLIKQSGVHENVASVLTTVGDSVNTGGRIPHVNPMRSIENVYSDADLLTWYGLLNFGETVTLDWKEDGVSCSLIYDRGLLIHAATRGDGDAGESILTQVRAMDSIPKKINVPIWIEIRGELVMKASTMARLNIAQVAAGKPAYVSTRNLVAGTIKLHDLVEVANRDIEFRPWEVLCPLLDAATEDPDADSASARLFDLSLSGFEPSIGTPANNTTTLFETLHEMLPKLSEPGQYGRDGIVIKVDSCARRRELGLGSKFARFQVAYKAQNARTESVLRDVIWQTGRQGRLTPVAVIDPVNLGGATIERVTLNNITWINAMGLKIGCRVEVVRSGDVIPQIVSVITD